MKDADRLARTFGAAAEAPEALARYEKVCISRANGVMTPSREGGLRLVSRSPGAYTPGRFASAGSLRPMDYAPLTTPL